jgi:uncharacterized metal-binding protein YceD (DUF177 family)
MPDQPAPFTHSFDLASLGEAVKTVELKPNASERGAIAAWAGIEALKSLSASVRVRRDGTDTYAYEGTFSADITQSCVVTLAPVKAHIEGAVSRAFRVVPQRARRARKPDDEAEMEIEGSDDDTEVLPSGVLDLARPILEEFVLAIDPYPRAPGAVFEAPKDEDKRENPFAALEKLKRER